MKWKVSWRGLGNWFYSYAKANGYSCLQVWVDTFTGWIEAFPSRSEQAKEVIKILTHEIIPRFGLPRSLQSDNGSAFKAAVTQGVSKALGIEYHLHCSWRPQSSGKVEKANDIIKRHLRKLTQETQDKWIKAFPIALMRCLSWLSNNLSPRSPSHGDSLGLPLQRVDLHSRG